MDEQIRIRVAEAPAGGARIAWSYLGTLLAALVATLIWAGWSPFGSMVCSSEDTSCQLGWNIVGWVLGMVVALALPAYCLRLGFAWWGVGAIILLSTPLWADGAGTAVIVVVVLLAPLLAAGVTWRGERQPRWLTWALVAILGVAIVGSVLMLLV